MITCSSLPAPIASLIPFIDPGANPSTIELLVSGQHRADFAVFTDNPGTEKNADSPAQAPLILQDAAEIDAIFQTLERQSDAYCNALFTQNKFQDRDLELISGIRRSQYVRHRHPDSLYSLRAGCRNFYEMNDFRPDRDFALVRAAYPGARFDCYSVGLLQPYIMQQILGCRRLTFIDINWRILNFHREIMQRTRSGAFTRPESVDHDLKGIELKFPALHTQPTRIRPAAVNHLCRPIQHKFCRKVLPDFQSEFQRLPPARLRFNLSTLHEGSYLSHASLATDDNENDSAGGEGAGARPVVRVIYLSNAIEESYTSRSEFLQLLRNLSDRANAASGDEEVTDVLIHHVGGWKLFGVYELRHYPGRETQLRTVCKDAYLSMSRGSGDGAVEYTTHFEAISKDRQVTHVPTCAQLGAQLITKD